MDPVRFLVNFVKMDVIFASTILNNISCNKENNRNYLTQKYAASAMMRPALQ